MKSTAQIVRWAFILLVLAPLFSAVGYAFLYSWGIVGTLRQGFTADVWIAVFNDQEFWSSCLYSLYIAVVATTGSVLLSLFLLSLYADRIAKGWFSNFFVIPFAISTTVCAFFIYQLMAQGGLLARMLYGVGLLSSSAQFPAVVNDKLGIAIILTHVFLAVPFIGVYFLNVYKNNHLNEVSESAQTLGLSERAAFWRLIAPIVLSASRSVVGLVFIFVFGSFEIPYLLGGQYPSMFTVHVIRKLEKYDLSHIPEAYAMSAFYALVLLLAVLILKPKVRAT